MVAVLPVLAVTVVEVVGNSVILEIGYERSSGTWTNSQSLRKTFINSIPMLPGGLWYGISMVLFSVIHQWWNISPLQCGYIISHGH